MPYAAALSPRTSLRARSTEDEHAAQRQRSPKPAPVGERAAERCSRAMAAKQVFFDNLNARTGKSVRALLLCLSVQQRLKNLLRVAFPFHPLAGHRVQEAAAEAVQGETARQFLRFRPIEKIADDGAAQRA